MERLQLLAQLHWALPHRLTVAEERLRDTELPQLTTECSALQTQLKVSALCLDALFCTHSAVEVDTPQSSKGHVSVVACSVTAAFPVG